MVNINLNSSVALETSDDLSPLFYKTGVIATCIVIGYLGVRLAALAQRVYREAQNALANLKIADDLNSEMAATIKDKLGETCERVEPVSITMNGASGSGFIAEVSNIQAINIKNLTDFGFVLHIDNRNYRSKQSMSFTKEGNITLVITQRV